MKHFHLIIFILNWMFIGNSLQGDAQIVTQFIIQDSNSCTWEYTIIADNEVEIKSVTGDIKIANIPSSVEYNGNDYNVSSIGKRAFYDCSSLLMVELPQSIKSIGDCAFYKCTLLKSIVIPNSVTNIGELAFLGCVSLKSVIISNSIIRIKDLTFQDCTSLTNIIIPNSVTAIGKWAFRGCSSLKDVKGLYSGIKFGEGVFLGTPFSWDNYKVSFEYEVNSYIIPRMKEWRQKREFETTAQYQNRVTTENQKKKVDELMKDAIKDYTTRHELQVTLGKYDADHQIFTLNSNYGQRYLKVPLEQAPHFKNNFARAVYNATYFITTDGPLIDDLTITLGGKTYHAEKATLEMVSNTIKIDLPEIDVPLNNTSINSVVKNTISQSEVTPIDQTIDKRIPSISSVNKNAFAVIIGNEQYLRVSKVSYACNDAHVFAEYCQKTLGLPEKNVRVYENATYGTMIGVMSDLKKIANAFKGDINVIFYYAGHGIPNDETKESYLLPIDADGMNTEVCYPLNRLYKELGELNAKQITVFMDACFSGAERGNGMIVAARGVAIKPKTNQPTGNTVVFSAATGQQAAYPYKEKGHGIFTYYLLKKLQETKGNVTLGELGEYICDEVAKQAVLNNGKEQTPTISSSASLADSWKKLKLK